MRDMKTMAKIGLIGYMALAANIQVSIAQKFDEERMKRDIEVAENVLSTLIKQELGQGQRSFFGIEIRGTYLPGYGVTFRLPGEFGGAFMLPMIEPGAFIYSDRPGQIGVTVGGENHDEEEEEIEESEEVDGSRTYVLKRRDRERRRADADSLRTVYTEKMIRASKDFILDYGDFISQLQPNEKIVVTNQGGERVWIYGGQKRRHISIEGVKSDVVAFRQGKITRDQALARLKVINTETVETKEPDMELLSSIFSRLYRPDLSKTYFTEENIYYERLRDYGAIYYMTVYSAYNSEYKRFNMPTVGLKDVDQETRDKKVIELYPRFEQEIKDNILEYGRTLKSLKDDESVVFNITLTKCKGCNIPSSLEVGIKSSVLKEYGAGKIDRNTALQRFNVKKGPNQ